MLQLKNYKIQKTIVTNEVLNAYITHFWNDVFKPINNLSNSKHLMLMCKVEFVDTGYRTLGHLRKVNYSDKELYLNYLSEKLNYLDDSYITNPISKIIFSYMISDGLAPDNRGLILDTQGKEIHTHRFNNMNLPISMDPADYGTIIATTHFPSFIRYIVTDNDKNYRNYRIDMSLDGLTNNVSIMGAAVLNWVDTCFGEGFKREINKSTIYFVNGEIVLRKQQFPAKPLTKNNKDRNLQTYFVTMDIETLLVNNKHIPYLLTAFNGTDYVTSFGNNQSELFSQFINGLFNFNFLNRSTKLIVYAHNLSGFDGIFLLKQLLPFGKVEPLIHNGKLISIKLKTSSGLYKGKTIIFKDSMLLLPLSLRLLCNAFNISIPKGYFPFKLTNIFYTGVLPKFYYWTGISVNIYESILKDHKNKIWSFKDESIKYCKLDCKCLHEILTQFNELIFNNFQINIHKTLTLPSLAMRIYKTHYMPKNTIYQLVGIVEQAIRESYSGGAVDVYIPHNRTNSFFDKVKALFQRIFIYDVNALYPYVMANHPMPIGLPTYFEGDIRKIDPEAYGFFYCKISSPYLQHPLIQRRIKTKNGYRTIAGLGSWYGWICSSELDNAMKYGYTFNIISGYQFKTGDIFSSYINKMYNLRLEYPKSHPMNLIAKLLMNSLYGKFGMKLESTKVDIFNTAIKSDRNLLDTLMKVAGETIKDFIKIDKVNIIVVRDSISIFSSESNDDLYHGQDVNIAIASAITAGARVCMSYFKNNPLFRLFYSDTDSAVIDRPLPDHMVGGALGQLKLEYIADKAVFLAPKVYGLVTEDGKEIIKVKGLTPDSASTLDINDLTNLLVAGSSNNISQVKWYKNVIEGHITKKEIAYTLKVTSNKREAIYTEGVFNDTNPFYYDVITSK
jgi:hypothetical protein